MNYLHYAVYAAIGIVILILLIRAAMWTFGVRIVGNTEVGIVEKIWGGAPLQGHIIALNHEPGFQPEVLRGGVHFLPGWKYRIHKVSLVTIQRGQIGYVFARDGQSLDRYTRHGINGGADEVIIEAGQTLAHIVNNGDFTDVRSFLNAGGQKGPQRAMLREGTYAINLAQFTVISGADDIAYLKLGNAQELGSLQAVAKHIAELDGFSPVVIDGSKDQIGIVTIHDGPSLPPGEIIAPIVGDSKLNPATYHNNFQDPEAFIRAGGCRGRQLQTISEGTLWLNQLFATVERIDKTVVPIGNVGVVVSYVGKRGTDTSGDTFSHGEQCAPGGQGIWNEPFLPGKYAFNTYAGKIVMVPTTSTILKWEGGVSGEHKLDASLREIELITKDAFEPLLPISVVISIDYKKAPNVIQRFGSFQNLINQSLDPMVASFFKNIGQTKTLIELIHERGDIQVSATAEMKRRFQEYDLVLQEVLLGTPCPQPGDTQIEQILLQLRDRQVAKEQVATYAEQQAAQNAQQKLNEAKALSARQEALTLSQVKIEIDANEGEAAARRAIKDADKSITEATAEARKTVLAADAKAATTLTIARAQAEGTTVTGMANAMAIMAEREARGSAELNVKRDVLMAVADALTKMQQPLVPHTLISMGSNGEAGSGSDSSQNMLTLLMTHMLEEKFSVQTATESKPESAMAADMKRRIEQYIAEHSAKESVNGTEPTKVGAI